MTEHVAALIRQQLVALEAYLQELRAFVSVDTTTYLTRPGFRRASERMIQIVVECAIDTAEAIAEATGRPPPPTARAAFGELHSLGVLDDELASLFGRRYVGLHNRIVHDYEDLDAARVQESGTRLAEDAERLARTIGAWVDRQAVDAGSTGPIP